MIISISLMDNIKSKVKHIYEIFFNKRLVETKKISLIEVYGESQNKSIKNPVQNSDSDNSIMLTPLSSKIYHASSPRSKPHVLRGLFEDNEYILSSETDEDNIDPDYQEKMENNGLGFFMEDFICAYGVCPVCGEKSLRKFSHSNVPVIDLVCINKKHHLKKKKCFVFQIKISLNTNYFSLKNQIISVGSKKYGNICHLRKGSDPLLHKIIVPGYICIKLSRSSSTSQEYIIDHKNSFVLIPNYSDESSDLYYQYLDYTSMYGKDLVTWNINMVETKNLDYVLSNNKIIHEIFLEKTIDNPYKDLVKLI
ncbi:hypothetical protein qu_584 [Acanthamoeba polyphaga mimivirus]|nr:hypothetical protein [Mimivirus reunion]WMV61918.1 hypothetical protein qu_584 [Mimivirus sp.]WMV62895.1 hypothetical protein qu_584 [Acanthamoeba polyphaga mimivirus]WMV63872.1 hypothetical protein qu_584 [Mimivirus sp.]